jgi:feruloyl esterase
VTDGVLDDPRQCRFEPATLLCRGDDSDTCLTAAQASALQKVYDGVRDSRGREVFPGFPPGAEEGQGGWGAWITGPAPGKSLLFAFATNYFGNVVYEKADWDYRQANLEQALKAAVEKTAEKLDATDPDLSAFRARGGKLILYHGWNDPAIPAQSTVRYYDGVSSRLGQQETEAFVRLYMVPGMQHCGGGPGSNSFGQFERHRRTSQRNVSRAPEDGWRRARPGPRLSPPSTSTTIRPRAWRRGRSVPTRRPRPQGQGDPSEAASFSCTPGGAPAKAPPAADRPVDADGVVSLYAGVAPGSESTWKGGHGFGMQQRGLSSDLWLDEFAGWLASPGFLTPRP